MVESEGVGGGVASCRGLLKDGSSKEMGGVVVVCRDLWEVSMYEGRCGSAPGSQSSLGDGRDMRDGRGCRGMSDGSVGKGECCRGIA